MRFDTFVHRFNHERPHQRSTWPRPQSLHLVDALLSRCRGARRSVSRLDGRGDALRPHLLPAAQGSISVRRSRGRRWASSRPPTISGWSASWSTTSATSTMRRVDSSRLTIPSARRCHSWLVPCRSRPRSARCNRHCGESAVSVSGKSRSAWRAVGERT
jgi:hypothetical protein